MKKVLTFLLVLMLGLSSLNVSAQILVEILGDGGTSTNQYLPAYTLYNNTLSEQIYTAEEVGLAGNITSIAFYNGGSQKSPNIKIYLVNTNKTEFTSSSDWMAVTEGDLVYEGDVTFTADAWTTIQFDNPFYYDGTSNLGLIVDENMQWSSGLACRVFNSTSHCAMYVYSDDINYNAVGASYSADDRLNVKNQIKLEITPTTLSCYPVSNLGVSDVTSTNAIVSWGAPEAVGTYLLQYKTFDMGWDDDNVVTVTPSDTAFEFSDDLLPNTTYNVRVANLCGIGDTSFWRNVNFTTECSAFQAPYSENFENYNDYSFPSCWTLISGYVSGSNTYPYIYNSSSSAHNGTGYLNLYPYSSSPNIVALPTTTTPLNQLRLTFWMRTNGTSSYYGRMEVGLMDDISDPSSFRLYKTYSATTLPSTEWIKYMLDFDTMTVTENTHIVFRCIVDNGYSWYLDDISLDLIPTCEAPTELAFINSTPNSVTVKCNPGEGTNFNVYYKTINDEEYTMLSGAVLNEDSTFQIMNLNPATNYTIYVTTVCDDGSETASDPIACATSMIPEGLPYTTDFSEESDRSWMLSNGNCVNYWVFGAPADTIDGALFVTTDGTTPGYNNGITSVVTASKLFTVGENPSVRISFDVKIGGESTYDYIKLFLAPSTVSYEASSEIPTYATNSYSTFAFDFSDYMSSSTSTSTIEYMYNLTNGVVHIDALMANPNHNPNSSSTAKVVFVWKNDGSQGANPGPIIYNVSVTIPDCPRPENVTVSNLTATTANLTWTGGNATQWELEYGPHGADADSLITINVTETAAASLTNLTENTEYDVYIKAICDDSESATKFMSFRTPCVGITTVPQSWDMENNNSAGTSSYPLPDCWSRPFGNYPYVYNYSYNAHSGSRSLSFYNSYSKSTAVMPAIDREVLDLNDLQVSFYAYLSSTSSPSQLQVGVMTNPADTATFTLVATVPTSSYYLVDPYVVSFENYTGTGSFIAFRNICNDPNAYSYYYIDDVVLETIPTCSKAVMLTSFADITSAQLSWTAQGDDFDLYYKSASDADYTQVSDVAMEDGYYLLEELADNTTYNWYIVTHCTDTDFTSNIASFTTECAAFTAPFTEDFNASTDLPDCWKRYTGLASDVFGGADLTPSTSGWTFSSTNVFGTSHAKVNIYSTCSYWLVSPIINISDLSTPALVFDLALTDYANEDPIEDPNGQPDDKFMVIISTDNGATWSAANATVWGNDASADHSFNQIATGGEEVVISLSEYESETIRIAFYAESTMSNGDNDLHIDNIMVGEEPLCAAPSHVTLISVSGDEATISWMENGDATSWKVEFDTVGFTPGDGTVLTANDTFITITNLDPNTRYDVYVSAFCDGGGNSNSAHGSFKTICAGDVALPFSEDFNSYNSNATSSTPPSNYPNDDMPDCWYFLNRSTSSGSYPTAFISSYSNYVVSGKCLFFQSSSTTPLYAVMPHFAAPLNTLQITFFYRNESTGTYNGTLSLGYMSDPGDASTFTQIASYPQIASLTEVTEVLSSIPAEAADGYLVFKYTGGSSSNYYLSIDDIFVEAIPTCVRPSDLHVAGCTSNSVTLGWTNGGDETSWNIEYGPVGFTPGDDEGTAVTATTNPFTVNNLSDESMYDFYVQANCGNGDVSTWRGPVTTRPGIYIMSANGYDSLTTCSVTIYDDGGPTGSYSTSCNSVLVIYPENAGDTISISGTLNSESSYDYLYIYDGVGTDGTQLGQSPYAGQGITIPTLTSSTGPITIKFTSDGSVVYGGYELTVTCTGGSGPGPVITDPTVVTNDANPVGQTTATLNATITNPDNVTITAKGFEWKTTTGGTFTQVAGTGTGNTFTANLTGLTASTSYTFKAFITYNGQTVYGTEKTFTTQPGDTPEPCDVPTNIVTSNITKESINVAWDNSDAIGWNVQYRPQNGTLSSASTTTNSYLITGLTPETTYEIQVQAVCADGTSEWSAIVTATTLVDGIENHLANSVSLYPNPAKEYVDIRVDGDVNITLMEVIDVYGKLINTVTVVENPTRLNVSGLADGMYFVRVTTDNGVVTKPFVKR